MQPIQHRQVQANDLTLHTVGQGEGPPTIFAQLFPESRYFWRCQLPASVVAGFHPVAVPEKQ